MDKLALRLDRFDRELESRRQTVEAALIVAIDAAMRHGIPPTRLGYAIGDPSFIPKLRRGHQFQLATLERANTVVRALLPLPAFLQDHE